MGMFVLMLGACAGGEEEPLTAEEQQAKDIADYEALSTQLAGALSEFLPERGAAAISAQGDRLFWVDDSEWDFKVRSWDSTTDATVAYDFTIGDAYDNYVVSDDLIATAREAGDMIEYDVYDVGAASQHLGTLTMEAPTDGQRWWAYAAHGADLYVAPTEPEPAIQRWSPAGGPTPTEVFTFADVGVDIGEFWGFGLDADHLIFAESGRIWSLDRDTNQATWLENETQVGGEVDLRPDGVLYATAESIDFWSYASSTRRNVTEEILASDYQLSQTYAAAHEPASAEFARYRDWIVYHGQNGIFAWNMSTDEIEPILLEPRDMPRTVYQNPQVLDDGTLFVEALVSESGSVGYDGPIYRVDTDIW